MKHQFDGYNYLLRLEKGEELISQLEEFARSENIAGAWINGIGASIRAEIGYYDLDNQTYKLNKLDRLMEITSLQGNISWQEDKPVVHLHGTFSDDKLQACGGHVKHLVVGGTCEIFVHIWNKSQLTRSHSAETGLNLLDL